jgi:hypothetical protein
MLRTKAGKAKNNSGRGARHNYPLHIDPVMVISPLLDMRQRLSQLIGLRPQSALRQSGRYRQSGIGPRVSSSATSIDGAAAGRARTSDEPKCLLKCGHSTRSSTRPAANGLLRELSSNSGPFALRYRKNKRIYGAGRRMSFAWGDLTRPNQGRSLLCTAFLALSGSVRSTRCACWVPH